MITSCLGELADNHENIFKLSRKKILFIFCIFILYKFISISFDLTFNFLIFAVELVFVGFKVECIAPIESPSPEQMKIILNCKYTF